ncbi:MAG: polysaccharide deacetylase family protein [Verrucomicrobiota bacterium]
MDLINSMHRAEFIKRMVAGLSFSTLPSYILAQETKPSAADEQSPETLAKETKEADASPVETPPAVNEVIRKPHFVNSGPGFGNRVALTYDDGPTPDVTDVILEELARRKLRATFFMIGNKIKAYPSLAKEVAAAGHEIANHTLTHPKLNRLSEKRVDYEIKKTQEIMQDVIGKNPVWFRPPYGAFRKNQGSIPMQHDLGIAYWSVDPRDWAKPGTKHIITHISKRTTAGSIILLHDLHKQTAQATPGVLDQLQEQAFNLTTMSGFLGHPYA